MSTGFADQVALVAGGTGGLGRAVSLALLQEGAHVIVTYRVQPEFDALQSAAQQSLLRLQGHEVDVTDEAAVRRLVDEIVDRRARIDVLVNAVGGYAGGATLWEQPAHIFEHMLSLNLRSGYALSRAVVPAMVKQGRGVIINVAAKAARDNPAGAAAYAASKAGALSLMHSLAAEVKGTGVRINSILPSIIDTEANRRAMPQADFASWPKPEEIARVVLFLCSDDAGVIHGAEIPVYGNR